MELLFSLIQALKSPGYLQFVLVVSVVIIYFKNIKKNFNNQIKTMLFFILLLFILYFFFHNKVFFIAVMIFFTIIISYILFICFLSRIYISPNIGKIILYNNKLYVITGMDRSRVLLKAAQNHSLNPSLFNVLKNDLIIYDYPQHSFQIKIKKYHDIEFTIKNIANHLAVNPWILSPPEPRLNKITINVSELTVKVEVRLTHLFNKDKMMSHFITALEKNKQEIEVFYD